VSVGRRPNSRELRIAPIVVDVATGLIKAVRSLQDPNRSAYAYLITASVDVTAQPSGRSTTVTVAASQQTVLHKDSEKYFHLLGLVPIPTGRVHQTVPKRATSIRLRSTMTSSNRFTRFAIGSDSRRRGVASREWIGTACHRC
jgi:hypothetical protein